MVEIRSYVRRLLPVAVVEWLVDFRSSERAHRLIFLRRQLRRVLRPDRPRDLSGVRSIIFVCYVNILRSPMAERLLRKRLEDSGIGGMQIASAGVQASAGKRADERGRISALDYDVSLRSHQAQS